MGIFLWKKPKRANAPLEFILYTREGCHLCEDAWEVLEKEQKRHHFLLRAVDVDTEASLAEQYGNEVPVVTVNGKVRFRGTLNPVLLRRILSSEEPRT